MWSGDGLNVDPGWENDQQVDRGLSEVVGITLMALLSVCVTCWYLT